MRENVRKAVSFTPSLPPLKFGFLSEER